MPPISPSDRLLGDLLVARHVLTLEQFDEAVRLAETWQVRLGDAILSRSWSDPQHYYRTIAEHFDLPFVNLLEQPPDPALLLASDADFYAQRLMIPWARQEGRILIATAAPGPEAVLAARQRWGAAIGFVVASKVDIVLAVQRTFDAALSNRAVFELAELDPHMSARQVVTLAQASVGYLLISGFLISLAVSPFATLIGLSIIMSTFYLGNFLLRAILVTAGGGRGGVIDREIAIEARALREEELPVFTILVPMFREAESLPILADALRRLDYPLGKLDIKIVLEASDLETITTARTLGLEGVFEIILVPPSQPQTKPKACNYALRFARGEFLVVYDAEDRPEPDQLRKVVAAFRRAPANTACLQCRLNYYNAHENWLTRMFTLDYSLWFDEMLPGLERLGLPIPLGGTSNHFKIAVLRELHGWDPFNVTEDADLGIRLAQKGYRVGVVDTTTFEEASCHAGGDGVLKVLGRLPDEVLDPLDPLAECVAVDEQLSGRLRHRAAVGQEGVDSLREVRPAVEVILHDRTQGAEEQLEVRRHGECRAGEEAEVGHILVPHDRTLARRSEFRPLRRDNGVPDRAMGLCWSGGRWSYARGQPHPGLPSQVGEAPDEQVPGR